MKSGAILVAAGSGTRMGRPKQFIPLLGRPVAEWSLSVFLENPDIQEVALVLSKDNLQEHGARLASKKVKIVEGGNSRMASVRNGFAALSKEIDVVAVHDGARPLLTQDILRAVLEEALRSGAALPAVPVKDTLKIAEKNSRWVSATPDRSSYWLAQTPQCYRREILEEALLKFPKDDDATDESQLVEKAGHPVKVVPSSYENIKITTPEDICVSEAILRKRHPASLAEVRSGFGYDIHRLVEGRELWLAGIKIPHSKGLLGHSDGDAVLHALCDAVLGAAGLGEIGQIFPPENPKIKGISSREIVAEVRKRLELEGASILGLDATLVAEEPRIKPHYEKMKHSLAALWELDPRRVSVKSKSHEGLGEIGEGRAIACYAVATISIPSSPGAP